MAEPIRKPESLARPVYPEPSPGPEPIRSETFELGSGSEVPPTAADRARIAVERVRDNFQDVASQARRHMDELSERASDVADQAGRRIHELRDQWNERYPELKHQALERIDDAKRRARQSAREVDARARRMPAETVAAAAIVGLVLGVTLRIWRASRG